MRTTDARTAKAAIRLLAAHSEAPIAAGHALLLGLGGCGCALARMLRFLRADISIHIYIDEERVMAEALGILPVPEASLMEALSIADLILLTPSGVPLTQPRIARARPDALFMDLSGGERFDKTAAAVLRRHICPAPDAGRIALQQSLFMG